MDTNFSFKIKERTDIDKMNVELEEFKKLKLKFLTVGDKYSKEQKETFLENFYNSKLNVLFSIINYYTDNGGVTKANNPFESIDNKEEIRRYSFKICDTLAKLNLNIISAKSSLVKMYDEITTIIENSRKVNKTFLRDLSFWDEIIKFYREYHADEEALNNEDKQDDFDGSNEEV